MHEHHDAAPDQPPPAPRPRTTPRRWRRTRPFWAGTLLLLAGAELVAVTCAPLPVVITLGTGGLATLGLGCALAAAGLFLWFLPRARHYVGLHAVLLAVFSFPASNLGGYFVGACLGIAGGAMGFAWAPGRPARRSRREPFRKPRRKLLPLPTGRQREAARRPAHGKPARPKPTRRNPPPAPPPSAALATVLPAVLLTVLLPRALGELPRAPGEAAAPAAAVSRPQPVTASRFTTSHLTITTVTSLPTAAGLRKVLALHMSSAVLADYRLRGAEAEAAHPPTGLSGDELRLAGDVTLFVSRFSGCLASLVCLAFDAEALPPPPVLPIAVTLTRLRADLYLIRSANAAVSGLRLTPSPGTASARTAPS
ncbi:DUF6114 domain-containing protein [Streptomyces huiliensis]|uniref:DUF6114 domain-containing protein n=1 Tax=Streptomyces huiliensis TaxID=2876027 RepID=UPI001CBC60F0|nr:DUF6114 domain-containing protein [Streptomyces huiliensis]MBZ4320838.1 DUF6114 domain-containing protein [Streptomyces huiliensis]